MVWKELMVKSTDQLGEAINKPTFCGQQKEKNYQA